MKSIIAGFLAVTLANASPLEKRTQSSAASYAGIQTSDVYPPTGTKVNSVLFPPESVIGYPGPTPTGAEPLAIQTAPVYPDNTKPFFPLTVGNISEGSDSDFSIYKTWGNLSPWYTVKSDAYGLSGASPLIPDQCSITQVHYLYRHGARYPTSGSAPAAFAQTVQNATKNGGFSATGDLAFLNTWNYKLGAELLTPYGRLQNVQLGVEARSLYGHLLNNFTQQGALPVFRTQSGDRMVKTAENFAAGFFGVPEYLDEVSIEIVVESEGFNTTGAPYFTCTNADVASRGSIGSAVATNYSKSAFADTASRIQNMVSGLNITTTQVVAMLQLCAYETQALGYSAFCPLFTEDEYKKLEYYFDLSFYYNNGFGSPVSAAQGLGYLQEFISRFEQTSLSVYNSTTNSTLDSNPATFPLNQSIYADATHEVVVLDTLSAFNFTALFSSGPLPASGKPSSQSFVASQVVPFATHFVTQVMECSNMSPTKQIRFLLNDAVIPIDKSYSGCSQNQNGLCAFDTVLTALRNRAAEIDFQYDCFGNYTAYPGQDYNGRAPRSA